MSRPGRTGWMKDRVTLQVLASFTTAQHSALRQTV
jgi:hypothetical protein